MTNAAAQPAELIRSTRRILLAGAATIVLTFGGLGGWAATTEIAGAVIASGLLVVEGNTKKVQHPTGGIVAELLVREGQSVRAGDTVIRLDATISKANLATVSQKLNQYYVRKARLEAERDGLAQIIVPEALLTRMSEAEAIAAAVSEKRLFTERRASRDGQKARLGEQINQLNEQISGLDLQQQAKAIEITLIGKELTAQRDLFEKGLTPLPRLNALERESARLTGERGQLIAAIASAKGRISEIELQRLQTDQAMRTEVSSELRDVETQMKELAEQEVAALDQLKRIEIKAPISGAVHQLAMHTIGGVITPAEVLMEIVPEKSDLIVEARIHPQDIDQLALGQEAVLQLTVFNRNTTPELHGRLTRISADLEHDKTTGESFYHAGIAIPQPERARVAELTLVPGMPIDAFIRTRERTVLSYLTKPLRDHAARVFREE